MTRTSPLLIPKRTVISKEIWILRMNGGNRVPLLGRFTNSFWSSPFLSYPIPIPAFHLSTGTLWNPFLHFRFIDQHGSSYSINWMVESRSVHEEWLFGETIPANKGSKNEFSPICYAVQSASLFHFPKHNCFRFTHSNANSSNDSLFHCL